MNRKMEFKDQTVEELKALHYDMSKKIYEMKNELRITRKIDKPHLIRKTKRDRARVLTLLSQKEERIKYEG